MELKGKLEEIAHFSTRKHVDNRLIYALGLFGIIMMAIPSWLMVYDWHSAGFIFETRQEARQAIDSLDQPIQALSRVMTDEQVQALAIRALENPQTIEDLTSYIKGRISQVSSVSVFGSDLSAVRPAKLGPNGYAMYDMLQSTLKGGKGLVQIHNILQPARAFDSAIIGSGGEAV
ncbi:MAG: hypothetical protein MUP31_08760, partial [Xanthomonadales bacterium]|nr:hypothetical protein [Xanthomonadales bacterium]